MQITSVKKLRRAICRIVGHDLNEEFYCKRCKHQKTYEELTLEECDKGIPHKIVMDYMRRKYMHLMPPNQQKYGPESTGSGSPG
jgi:hypothetical protein